MLKLGFKNLITFCLFFSSFLLLLNANTAFAATVTLAWDAPTTNVDGSQLTDLAGHRLYYGTASGNYGQSIDVAGNVTTYTVTNLSDNTTYYFVVTARDTSNNESAYSNEECFNSAGSCGGSGGGGNQNASNTSGTEVSGGGGGCGFVKDDSDRWLKGQSVKSESNNILNLALLILLLTILRLKVMFQQAMGGYSKMNKLFSAMVFSLILFNNPAISYAAVNLPWSTTYKCPEWIQSGLDNVNCDGLAKYGDWTTANGSREQITAVANYPSGAGGKGQRHWLGNRVTVDEANSGGTRIDFASPQPELWVRWYMRFQKDFQWDPNNHPSFKALFFDVGPYGVVTQFFGWEIVRFWVIVGDGTQIPGSTIGGWDTIMANGANDGNGHKMSDGQWHLYEIHMKMDTNGSNGVAEMWVDGVERFSYSNINYGTRAGWNFMVIGSNHNYSTNGGDMYVDYDDFAISATGPIGSICPDCPDSPKKLRKP